MRQHVETHEEMSEGLKRPVVVSLSCHAGLLVLTMVWSWFSPPPFQFGETTGDAGSALAVNVVDGIPLDVPRTQPNPVANPVEHQVPAAPEPPEPEPPPKPEPPKPNQEVVPIEDQKKPEPKPVEPKPKVQKSAPKKEENQISSSTGAQASSELFTGTQQAAGAGVGMSGRDPFGEGFAWYALDLQRRLSASWQTALGQVSGDAAKPATVRFTIMQNGAIRDIRVVGSSGNRSVDYSAHRAVLGIDPFKPLPAGLRRSAITVEIYFQLK